MEVQSTLTSAGRLRLVPLGVVGVHAFDGDRALLQGVAGVAGELHHSAHGPAAVAAGQVSVLHKGLVAVAGCEGCGGKVREEIILKHIHSPMDSTPQSSAMAAADLTRLIS